jgi:hypothetical protein
MTASRPTSTSGRSKPNCGSTCDQAQGIRREVSEAHRQIHEQERPTYSGLGGRIESCTPSPTSPSCSPCLAPRSTGRSSGKTAQRADPPTHIARSSAPGDTILTGLTPLGRDRRDCSCSRIHPKRTGRLVYRGPDPGGRASCRADELVAWVVPSPDATATLWSVHLFRSDHQNERLTACPTSLPAPSWRLSSKSTCSSRTGHRTDDRRARCAPAAPSRWRPAAYSAYRR